MFTVLRNILASLKHWVLDTVHPLPTQVVVTCSEGKTLDSVLLTALEETDRSGTMVLQKMPTPGITLQIDNGVEVSTDVLSVIRYVGRLSRLYHVAPENALIVDSYLQLIPRLISEEATKDLMQTLEKRMNTSESVMPWMGGFEEQTIADYAWYAAFMWAFEQFPEAYKAKNDLPMFVFWWNAVREDEEDTEEEDEEDEEDKKEN